MDKVFLVYKETSFSYNRLIKDVNSLNEIPSEIFPDDVYEFFVYLTASLVYDIPIIIKDAVQSLTPALFPIKRQTNKEFNNFTEITPQNWRLTLYTSGTTGVPKKITHSFENLKRYVTISDEKINNVWGFAYNPTHIAGVQVFLEGLLNSNSFVYLFDEKPQIISHLINENQITHISATPSFFNLFLDSSTVYKTVKKATVGGEPLSDTVTRKLKHSFPNADLRNVYASTEAGSVLSGKGNVFVVRDSLRSSLKIMEGVLYLKSSLLGDFDYQSSDTWYCTGDRVELITDEPLTIKVLGRESQLINVGGEKVDPLEVENLLLTFEGISQVKVYGIKNSVLGFIIGADIVTKTNNLTEAEVKVFLMDKLPKYKIPRIVNFVNEINLTRTGKISRI